MNFMGTYLQAMRQQAPGMFNELARAGKLETFAHQKSVEAHRLLNELLAPEPKGVDGLPKDPQALRLAEERVMGEMLDFPVPERDQHPEPPDDLPQPKSQAKTSPLQLVR
jgi:hypothetical protein